MATPYVGQISMFGGNFAPSGWAMCNGQLLQISQYTTLYALIGTAYGGDGLSTFGLPNLISRLPVHIGNGLGLSSYALGQAGGVPNVTIDTTTMPSHTHALNATTAQGNTGTISNAVIPATPTGSNNPELYAGPGGVPPPTYYPMAAGACTMTGGSQPHSNLMPSVCITFIIALTGVYPSRS